MTTRDEAASMLEQGIIGPGGYDYSRDTPARMEYQAHRSFKSGAEMGRALGIPERTARRWYSEGIPAGRRGERARKALSDYYAERRGPRKVSTGRRDALRAGSGSISLTFTQNTEPPRTRTLGTDQSGAARITGADVAELFRAFERGADRDQLLDIFLGMVKPWYRRAVIPAGDGTPDYAAYDVEPDELDSFADDGDDAYASVNWAWQSVSVAA